MKLSYLLLVMFILISSSCKKNNDDASEQTKNRYNKDDAASYNTQLGLAYLKQGDRPLAKRKLLLALKQAPDSPNVNASMAYFMEKAGELDNAQAYYQKAMALAPGNGAQLNNYGTFLCRQASYQQAEEYFLKAVQDSQYEHTSGAYENAGLCALAIPDYPKAKKYFKKALEQDPSRKQSLIEIVNIDVKNGRINEALTILRAYPALTMHDRTLLTLAVDVANKAGSAQFEAEYKQQLQQLYLAQS